MSCFQCSAKRNSSYHLEKAKTSWVFRSSSSFPRHKGCFVGTFRCFLRNLLHLQIHREAYRVCLSTLPSSLCWSHVFLAWIFSIPSQRQPTKTSGQKSCSRKKHSIKWMNRSTFWKCYFLLKNRDVLKQPYEIQHQVFCQGSDFRDSQYCCHCGWFGVPWRFYKSDGLLHFFRLVLGLFAWRKYIEGNKKSISAMWFLNDHGFFAARFCQPTWWVYFHQPGGDSDEWPWTFSMICQLFGPRGKTWNRLNRRCKKDAAGMRIIALFQIRFISCFPEISLFDTWFPVPKTVKDRLPGTIL